MYLETTGRTSANEKGGHRARKKRRYEKQMHGLQIF